VSSPPGFSQAFAEGQTIMTCANGPTTVSLSTIGELIVPSGTIVACDPFTAYTSLRVDGGVAPGRYPVVLSLANVGKDYRVACALLQFSDQVAVRWHPVRIRDEDPLSDWESLWEGQPCGYPVDNAVGSFMDTVSAELLGENRHGENLRKELDEGLRANRSSTWSHANITADTRSGANIIAFTSGAGDGVYTCYWGYDSNGAAVGLLTDFGTFDLESTADL
jgi:hypothetical protein